MKYLGKKKTGFILAETVAALFVTALTVVLLQVTISIAKKAMLISNSQNIRIHVVQEKLERDFVGQYPVQVLDANRAQFLIDEHQEKGVLMQHTKTLVVKNNILKLQDSGGGYQPILMGVKKIDFKLQDNLLLMTLVDQNQRNTELYFTNAKTQ